MHSGSVGDPTPGGTHAPRPWSRAGSSAAGAAGGSPAANATNASAALVHVRSTEGLLPMLTSALGTSSVGGSTSGSAWASAVLQGGSNLGAEPGRGRIAALNGDRGGGGEEDSRDHPDLPMPPPGSGLYLVKPASESSRDISEAGAGGGGGWGRDSGKEEDSPARLRARPPQLHIPRVPPQLGSIMASNDESEGSGGPLQFPMWCGVLRGYCPWNTSNKHHFFHHHCDLMSYPDALSHL
jgi:hypothetical protein